MKTSEKSATIAAALYAVHRDLENPRKDAKGQVRGRADYRYLSLPALIDHAKAALKEAQVAVIQDVHLMVLAGNVPGVGVSTTFLHLTGEWVEVGPLAMPLPADPQQLGSATTYLRRYALAAALNLAADEDDDAQSASTRAPVSTVAAARAGDGNQAEGAPAGIEQAKAGHTGGRSPGEGPADAPTTVEGGGALGEAASTPSAPKPVSDAQRWMDEFHPGKPHKLRQSDTVPTLKFCGINDCPYAVEVANA